MSDLLSRLESLKATERKAETIAAYDAACASPSDADWQTIAHALRRCLPNPRKVPAADDTGGNVTPFAPWYEGRRPSSGKGKDFGSVRAEITFADGRMVRTYALTYKGSAPNIAGAVRSACDRWRYQTQAPGTEWQASVPDVVAVSIPDLGLSYDPAIANEKTAESRAPSAAIVRLNRSLVHPHAKARLEWFICPPVPMNTVQRIAAQEETESRWLARFAYHQDIAPLPELMPDEPAPSSEAMPAPRKPASDLTRRLLASALASPSVEAMPHPCIMVKPVRTPFAIAA